MLFPEGIVYDRQNDEVRTPRTNSVMELVRCLSTSFIDKKRGQTVNFNNLSSYVTPNIQSSNFLKEDLLILGALLKKLAA